MNEFRVSNTTVLALLLAWLLLNKRDSLKAAVRGVDKVLRVPFGTQHEDAA